MRQLRWTVRNLRKTIIGFIAFLGFLVIGTLIALGMEKVIALVPTGIISNLQQIWAVGGTVLNIVFVIGVVSVYILVFWMIGDAFERRRR